MVDAAVATEKMTLDDFIRLYDTEGPFEFVNGERIPLMPQVSGHSEICKRLFLALLVFETKNIGYVFQERTFTLLDQANWVKGARQPDVMFFLKDRIDTYKATTPDWKEKPYILVPDLAVEVISKNDSYSDVELKVTNYLEDGVRLVWVIDPRSQSVTVHQAGSKQQLRLSVEDTLIGGAVLPDFAIAVASLFE